MARNVCKRTWRKHSVEISLYRIRCLRKKLRLRCKQIHKCEATTDSNYGLLIASNLLAQKLMAESPDHVWLGDLVYIATVKAGCIWLG